MNILADPPMPDVRFVFSEDVSPDWRSATVFAHKSVLIHHSPVFKAMFENDMQESRSGIIQISDASYDALRAFVYYLYTAEVLLDEQKACELLVLADKYLVEHLKTDCEIFLVSNLNWENSIGSYAFAQRYNANLLLDEALRLITANMNRMLEREDYNELDPELLQEIGFARNRIGHLN